MSGACSRLKNESCTTVTWIIRLCAHKINLGQNMRICSVPAVFLREGEYGALPLFGGSLAKTELHKPPGIDNIFAGIAACYVYKCIQGNSTILAICHFGVLVRTVAYYCNYANYTYYVK